jgi:hypothetical protein
MCHMRRRIHVSYEEEDTCVLVRDTCRRMYERIDWHMHIGARLNRHTYIGAHGTCAYISVAKLSES